MSKTALLFFLLYASGLLLAFWKQPIYGVYSYMLAFYASPDTAWWAVDLPDLRWSLLAAAVTLVARLFRPSLLSRPSWYSKGSALLLVAFTIWLWLQYAWALSAEDHLFFASLFTKYVFLYAALYMVLSDPQNLRRFFLAHIAGCSLWGYMAYLDPGAGRLDNIGAHDVAGSNYASMHLTTGVAFAGFVFVGLSGSVRWMAFASLPFILNAIILTGTRGAFLGLIATTPASVFLAPRSRRLFVTACLTLGIILFLMLAHDLFWSRMATLTVTDPESMETSAQSRIEIARYNLQMFADNPLGVGHRGNDVLSPRYMPARLLISTSRGFIRSAHNTPLAILVDHGFIGFILMACFHLSIAWSLIRSTFRDRSFLPLELRAYRAALGTSLVAYWVNAQFANAIKAEIVVWIAVLVASLDAVRAPRQKVESGVPRL